MNPIQTAVDWGSYLVRWNGQTQRTLMQKVILFGLCIAFGIPLLAQGKVNGKITTETGDPIENVCVEATQNGKVIEFISTDKNGLYTIEYLQEGVYDFVVYYRMEEKRLNGIKVYKDRPTFNKITLVKKAPVIPYYAGDIDLAIQE